MEIYLDELFALNFISCLFMIHVYSLIIKFSPSVRRRLIAATVGAVAACVRFLCPPVAAVAAVVEIAVPLISFGKISWQRLALFFALKYAFLGLAAAAVSIFGGGYALIRNGIIYLDVHPALFFASLVLSALFYEAAARFLRLKRRRIFTLIISAGEKNAKLSALYDSGNLLKNPYDGTGVVIAYEKSIGEIIPPETVLIPFRSLGNESGLLKAFKAERIYCVENGKTINNATVGISALPLSKSGAITALIGSELLKEED